MIDENETLIYEASCFESKDNYTLDSLIQKASKRQERKENHR